MDIKRHQDVRLRIGNLTAATAGIAIIVVHTNRSYRKSGKVVFSSFGPVTLFIFPGETIIDATERTGRPLPFQVEWDQPQSTPSMLTKSILLPAGSSTATFAAFAGVLPNYHPWPGVQNLLRLTFKMTSSDEPGKHALKNG